MAYARLATWTCLLLAACDPGVPALDGSTTGAEPPSGGNFPDDALAACGPLPDGVDALPDLASAYAVTGARPSGSTTEAAVVRLRLSSWGIDADASFPDYLPTHPSCTPGWAIGLDVSASPVVGLVELGAIVGEWEQDDIDAGAGGGCYSGGGEVGGSGQLEVSGTLELFTVSDTCIIGEFAGVDPGTAGLRNGGFVAVRSAVACVPTSQRCM